MTPKGGQIVNIMSSRAKNGLAGESLYCAAKWGARGYTESLQALMKGKNIDVIAVYPGGINTDFWKNEDSLVDDTSKFMDPDDVAATICDAIDIKKSSFVNDITITRKYN